MYIVRWLMGHPIIAIWVLGAIAILLVKGSNQGIQSENTPVQVEKIQPDNATQHATDVSGAQPLVKAKKAPKLEKDATEKTIGSQHDQEISTVQSGKENQLATKKTEPQSAPDLKNAVSTNISAVVSEKKEIDVLIVETPQIPKAMNEQTETSTISEVADLQQSNTEEMLLMAREAYWNNGLEEAAAIYQALIKLEPDVIEHKGELGNVYWRQGYPKKAAELYSEIAIPMIEQGNADRVANMVGFIGLFYPDKAAEIHGLIQSKTNNKNQ